MIEFDGVHDGPTNMARDADLLSLAEEGHIAGRVYAWEGAWVSLGRFQDPSSALLADAPVRWVERPTGGRGVLHGHDVTIGLAFPLAELVPASEWRSIRAVYRAAIAPIVAALCECGVNAGLGESMKVDGVSRSPDCFAAVSANDVVDLSTGMKVCGCALRLTDSAVLAQCSIPAGPPLVDPSLVYPQAAPIHWIELDHAAFARALGSVIGASQARTDRLRVPL